MERIVSIFNYIKAKIRNPIPPLLESGVPEMTRVGGFVDAV